MDVQFTKFLGVLMMISIEGFNYSSFHQVWKDIEASSKGILRTIYTQIPDV